MAGAAQASDEEITGINVTPFVDICLVLLVIFMVTAKYLVTQSIPVDLPEASSSTPVQSNDTVNLTIDASGQLFVDTTRVDEPALRAQLQRRAQETPALRAIINADHTLTHGRVTHLIDLVRLAGITHFAIQTAPVTNTEPAPVQP